MNRNILILFVLIILNLTKLFADNNETYNDLLKDRYRTLFFLSLPITVKPSSIVLLEINKTNNKEDVKFRIEGEENNKTIWVNGVFEIKDNIIINLKWKERNTLLVPPKKSYIINRLLKNMTYEYQWIKTRRQWTNNTSSELKENLFRKRLYYAINNAFFLDKDKKRKNRWLNVIHEMPIKQVRDLIPATKRENIRYLLKQRILGEELNRKRANQKN